MIYIYLKNITIQYLFILHWYIYIKILFYQGVSVYDIDAEVKIGTIERPKNSPRAELFKCNLYWKSDNELICGWADNIKVIQIKETKSDDVLTALTSSVQKYLEVVYE